MIDPVFDRVFRLVGMYRSHASFISVGSVVTVLDQLHRTVYQIGRSVEVVTMLPGTCPCGVSTHTCVYHRVAALEVGHGVVGHNHLFVYACSSHQFL